MAAMAMAAGGGAGGRHPDRPQPGGAEEQGIGSGVVPLAAAMVAVVVQGHRRGT